MVETKHYVEFLYPGALVAETSVEVIEERNPSKIKIPKDCYGFRFFDRLVTDAEGETLMGNRKNYSGMYYPEGNVLTLKEVKETMPEKTVLISNMEVNGWNEIIETRMGNIQPFKKEDILLA